MRTRIFKQLKNLHENLRFLYFVTADRCYQSLQVATRVSLCQSVRSHSSSNLSVN